MANKEVVITNGSFGDAKKIAGKAILHESIVISPLHILSPVFCRKDKGFELIGFEIIGKEIQGEIK